MKGFNIRVYGLLINDKQEILLSQERIRDLDMCKFPGGGLEWGEGLQDALVREFKEEMNLDIEVSDLFYLTDFFQQSAFNPKDQLISVYYKVIARSTYNFPKEITIDPSTREVQFWKPLNELRASDLTFPIDQHVVKLLREC